MNKTLADLKRDLTVGVSLTLTEAPGNAGHRYLGVKRYVIKTQTNGISLAADPAAKSGSFLDFPKASLLEYDGEMVRIYAPGRRPLTAREQAVLDNRPSRRPEYRAQVEQDCLTDGSTMYWKDREYWKTLEGGAFLYLNERQGGKRMDWNDNVIIDEAIKGDLILVYKVEK